MSESHRRPKLQWRCSSLELFLDAVLHEHIDDVPLHVHKFSVSFQFQGKVLKFPSHTFFPFLKEDIHLLQKLNEYVVMHLKDFLDISYMKTGFSISFSYPIHSSCIKHPILNTVCMQYFNRQSFLLKNCSTQYLYFF